LKFQLKPKQQEFVSAIEQFPAYIAAIGTGKTTALINRSMILSTVPNSLGVIVRKNFVDLRDSTMRDFELYTGLTISKDTKEVRLPNNSIIMFRHGDELPVLKNLNLAWFGIEQAEEFNDSNSWDMLTMRLRRAVPFRTGFLIANADGHNWVWKKWVENGAPKNHRCTQATTYEFQDILPPDYIKNLEANLPKKLFNRYVMNSHEEFEGLVYDEYLESRDTIEPFTIPKDWERGFVLDHGFRNPTAVLFYAIDYDGNVFIYNEHYKRELPISEHARIIKTLTDKTTGYADPSIFNKTMSRGSYMYSIADEYSEFGITLNPALRSAEDASIARVNEFFKAGRIKIFKNNINTIKEVGNWKWKEMRPGVSLNLKEEPEDKDNHACDALKYLISSRFSKTENPKEKIKVDSLEYYDNHLQQIKLRQERNSSPVW